MIRITTASALLLAACADASTPQHQEPGSIRIAAWNLEHLAERDGEGCRPRTGAEYASLKRYADALDAHVIAFQEVQSHKAAARVFTPDRWTVVIETRRARAQGGCRGMPGQVFQAQRTGLAIRRGLPFKRHPDVAELGLGNRRLRWGVDVTLKTRQPIRLLAIHLKAGCNSGRSASDEDCDVFFEQVPVLEQWIDRRAREGDAYAVLGDWNRRLASRGDVVWSALDDHEPANADLTLASGKQRAKCKARFTEFIDHIALDRRASARMIDGTFQEFVYQLPEAEHPSDHCPVAVLLRN